MLTFALGYYNNPLVNVELTEWNRTFSLATIGGISIDRRVANFFRLFLLYQPLICILFISLLSYLFFNRKSYKDIWVKLCTLFCPVLFSAYISRYSAQELKIVGNPLIQCFLAFCVILYLTALIDKNEIYTFGDVTMFFVAFMIVVISAKILLRCDTLKSIFCVALFLILYIKCEISWWGYICSKAIFILLWLPALMRIALEVIYILIERGFLIEK